MNIFAILYCYPPLLVPATMCYLKLIKGLREYGFNIDVFTIDPRSFVPPGNNNPIDPMLNQFVVEDVINHKVWSWESNIFLKTLKRFDISYRLFYKMFEPRKKEWIFPAIKYLNNLDLNNYDVILSCSQPHTNHLIGHYLKEKTLKPWIAYFSDPWTDNPYTIYKSEKIRHYNQCQEKEIIGHADKVLFTSQEMRALVMKKYPDSFMVKSGVLPHCFVPEWYEPKKEDVQNRKNGKIRVLHTGHFYGPRTPMPFFNALLKLHKIFNLSEKVEILFYGNMSKKYHEFVITEKMDSFIRINGTISYHESLTKMKESDYLLLIDAPLTDTSESVFLPSKLIDYIGSFKPVMGITPEKGASQRVIRESGNLSCDIKDEDEIHDVFQKLIKNSLDIKPNKNKILDYHYKNVTQKLVDIIHQLA